MNYKFSKVVLRIATASSVVVALVLAPSAFDPAKLTLHYNLATAGGGGGGG